MAETDVADNSMPVAPLEETDEQRRQRLAQLPLANALPPAPADAATAQSAPPPAIMPAAPPPPAQGPANANAAKSVAPDVSAMPAAPAPIGPAQQRLKDLTAKGPPKLPFWKQALDVLGGLHPIGREIEANIPGSPQNYSARMNQAEERAEKEQQIAGTTQTQAEQKQRGEREAQESSMVEIPGHPEYGKVELKNYPAIVKQIEANEGKEATAGVNQAGATEREQMKIDAKPAIANGLKFGVLRPDIVAQIGPMPDDPAGQKEWGENYDKLLGKAGKQTGLGTYAMVRLLDYFQKYNPEGLKLMPQIMKQAGIDTAGITVPAIPPGQPTDENGKPIGNAQPGAPTSQTRTMGQMAEKVLDRLPDIRKEVDSLKDYLGPAKGRLSVAFLLGKVGSTGDDKTDRDLSRLRQDMTMMATAGARFHINSVQAMEQMEADANAGKDSAPALQGAIDGIEKWATGAKNEGRGRQPNANAPKPGAATGGMAAWKAKRAQSQTAPP